MATAPTPWEQQKSEELYKIEKAAEAKENAAQKKVADKKIAKLAKEAIRPISQISIHSVSPYDVQDLLAKTMNEIIDAVNQMATQVNNMRLAQVMGSEIPGFDVSVPEKTKGEIAKLKERANYIRRQIRPNQGVRDIFF
jgi:beta-mannanase